MSLNFPIALYSIANTTSLRLTMSSNTLKNLAICLKKPFVVWNPVACSLSEHQTRKNSTYQTFIAQNFINPITDIFFQNAP
ncbi:hypothetical protein AY599_21345 [Leptolyngbya valderiana BDU 20041]|nr:hypothetical protein AY599_21345 [Leptolyngbya valderiana BDU 20041]